MLGKSPSDEPLPEERKQPLTVQGIPPEFYGGANPVIHFKTTSREVDVTALGAIPVADQKAHAAQTAAGGTNALHPVHFFSDPKKLVLASVAVLGVAVLGAGAYYLLRLRSTPAPIARVTPRPTTSVVADLSPVAPVVEQPTTPAVVPVTLNPKIETPSLLLGDTADDDQDLLTDQEETVFRSDPGVVDTDNDSYHDAHETYFLYSPIEKEPSRLINSGTVTEYTNPNFGYTLFYPSSWLVGGVDPDNRDVLFTSISGEYIEFRVFDRPVGVSFEDWLASVAPGERMSDLQKFVTRAGENGLARQDYLMYYFQTSDKIMAMVYHPAASQTEISFRSTMLMMARSFRAGTALESFSAPGINKILGERKKSFVTSVTPAPLVTPASVSTTESMVASSTVEDVSASSIPTTSTSTTDVTIGGPTSSTSNTLEASSSTTNTSTTGAI